MPLRLLAAVACALILTGCTTARDGLPPRETSARPPTTDAGPRPEPPRRLALADLPGWAVEDHAAALASIRQTCGTSRDPAVAPACVRARDFPPENARAFLEQTFVAERYAGEGVLTAYFAPVYPGRRRPDDAFSAPVRARPDDLKVADGGIVLQILPDGSAQPYPDRTAIESRSTDRPLAWMRPEELFFLQVQGSGVLVFEDGRRTKVLYAAHNGRPFVGIANPMRDRGLLPRDNTSGDAIRNWLAANRGRAADEIMRLNPRYAFFSLAPDDGKPPVGAANVPLPTGRAVAVDPAFHAMGELLWIDGEAPLLIGAFPTYRRLVTALDTGGAIKGEVRADLYLGEGAQAGAEAGRVRHTLRLYRLVPR